MPSGGYVLVELAFFEKKLASKLNLITINYKKSKIWSNWSESVGALRPDGGLSPGVKLRKVLDESGFVSF
ncbi:hypothetical protein PSDVSF_28270 [Pseudodesulfovibrio sediminis]|uniref:Uncharacterized protein n=1 Tax=Pseudodesulfovibrio sediminis TaxID=2810563 RepID=A0ABM7P963_9BACT|nr:hypothetical protein PSDVSF_28270 [Pseudodesulfovibrio sediminis]